MIEAARPTSASAPPALFEIDSSAIAIEPLMPMPSSRRSRSLNLSRSAGSSGRPRLPRNPNRVSADACTDSMRTRPSDLKWSISAFERMPSITTVWPAGAASTLGPTSLATAPGPPRSRRPTIREARLSAVGSRPLLAASALTASPMLTTVWPPRPRRPSAIVDLPAPGMPVRHTMSLPAPPSLAPTERRRARFLST